MGAIGTLLPLVLNEIEAALPYGLGLLERLVGTESYSRDPIGVNHAQSLLEREWAALGMDVKRWHTDAAKYGDHLGARMEGERQGTILLLGHVDTAHPAGTLNRFPFSVEGNRAYGPGIADMKGGIVAAIVAIKALRSAGWKDHPTIEVLLTPDEEIGSPVSRELIAEKAKDAAAVFNLEPARQDGSVVTRRKGSAHLAIEIVGRGSHAGSAIEKGVSALSEAAHKTIALDALTDLDEGVTVNVGTVSGGTSTNSVAERASLGVHCGFWTVEQAEVLLSRIRDVVRTSFITGTTSSVTGGVTFLPMIRTEGVQQLFVVARDAADELGLPLVEIASMGASDAGFAAHEMTPTLCGLGPFGGDWHSDREYIDLTSYDSRVKLLTWSIVKASVRLC